VLKDTHKTINQRDHSFRMPHGLKIISPVQNLKPKVWGWNSLLLWRKVITKKLCLVLNYWNISY